MSESQEPSENPYQSPVNPYDSLAQQSTDGLEATEKIKKFREQMHALGALWIIIGSLAIGLSLYSMNEFPNSDHPMMGVMGIVLVLGVLWFVLGIATCFKLIGAVYVGLAISYLSLLSNILSLNICGTVIVIVVILQAHRVIKWAGDLKDRRIPLNAKP